MQPVRRVLAVGALVLVVLLASGASADGRASTATAQVPPFLWGAWIGTQFSGSEPPWDWQAVTDFDARNAGGRDLSVLHWGVRVPWVREFNYWLGAFNLAQNAGALSVVDVETGSASLRKVAKGAYDSALRTWASEAKSWGHLFFLRFDWEMNGQWEPWGTRPRNRNTPGDFVAAWRHVHRIFTAAGATNVRWVWCPNIDPYREMTSLARLYPGRAYVDWTCLDGYNFGRPWTSFSNLYARSYQQIMRLAPSKPMMIGEVASTGHGGNKARWISSMFQAFATRFRRVHGLLWWDEYGTPRPQHHPGRPSDWPIETSPASSTAFSRGISKTLTRMCRRLTGSAPTQCLGKATS
jgi:hypothetical protein